MKKDKGKDTKHGLKMTHCNHTYLNTGLPLNVSIIKVLFSIALCTANAS